MTSNAQRRLLLLSNSRNSSGEYLVHARDAIRQFVHKRRKALFFPFAGTTIDWDGYTTMVQSALAHTGLELRTAHTIEHLDRAIADTEVLIVGGGNTFRLLHEIRVHRALTPLKEAVNAGMPYIGWSAGAVLAGPTICTTNDMPIVDPGGFDALGVVPFQINAHYTNALPPGHQGETRNQRLAEYLVLNPHSRVLGLPEGNWLEVDGLHYQLNGPHPSWFFLPGQEPAALPAGAWHLP